MPRQLLQAPHVAILILRVVSHVAGSRSRPISARHQFGVVPAGTAAAGHDTEVWKWCETTWLVRLRVVGEKMLAKEASNDASMLYLCLIITMRSLPGIFGLRPGDLALVYVVRATSSASHTPHSLGRGLVCISFPHTQSVFFVSHAPHL